MKKAIRVIKFSILPYILALSLYLWVGVEGSIVPVTTEFNIETISTTYDSAGFQASVLTGTFTKLRNCEFKELTWYYGTRENRLSSVGVKSIFTSAPQVRSTGEQYLASLYVYLPRSDVMNNSFAYVTHSCYNLSLGTNDFTLWTTKTLFYETK